MKKLLPLILQQTLNQELSTWFATEKNWKVAQVCINLIKPYLGNIVAFMEFLDQINETKTPDTGFLLKLHSELLNNTILESINRECHTATRAALELPKKLTKVESDKTIQAPPEFRTEFIELTRVLQAPPELKIGEFAKDCEERFLILLDSLYSKLLIFFNRVYNDEINLPTQIKFFNVEPVTQQAYTHTLPLNWEVCASIVLTGYKELNEQIPRYFTQIDTQFYQHLCFTTALSIHTISRNIKSIYSKQGSIKTEIDDIIGSYTDNFKAILAQEGLGTNGITLAFRYLEFFALSIDYVDRDQFKAVDNLINELIHYVEEKVQGQPQHLRPFYLKEIALLKIAGQKRKLASNIGDLGKVYIQMVRQVDNLFYTYGTLCTPIQLIRTHLSKAQLLTEALIHNYKQDRRKNIPVEYHSTLNSAIREFEYILVAFAPFTNCLGGELLRAIDTLVHAIEIAIKHTKAPGQVASLYERVQHIPQLFTMLIAHQANGTQVIIIPIERSPYSNQEFNELTQRAARIEGTRIIIEVSKFKHAITEISKRLSTLVEGKKQKRKEKEVKKIDYTELDKEIKRLQAEEEEIEKRKAAKKAKCVYKRKLPKPKVESKKPKSEKPIEQNGKPELVLQISKFEQYMSYYSKAQTAEKSETYEVAFENYNFAMKQLSEIKTKRQSKDYAHILVGIATSIFNMNEGYFTLELRSFEYLTTNLAHALSANEYLGGCKDLGNEEKAQLEKDIKTIIHRLDEAYTALTQELEETKQRIKAQLAIRDLIKTKMGEAWFQNRTKSDATENRMKLEAIVEASIPYVKECTRNHTALKTLKVR